MIAAKHNYVKVQQAGRSFYLMCLKARLLSLSAMPLFEASPKRRAPCRGS